MITYNLTHYWRKDDEPEQHGKSESRYATAEAREQDLATSLYEQFIQDDFPEEEWTEPEEVGEEEAEQYSKLVALFRERKWQAFSEAAIGFLEEHEWFMEVYRSEKELDLANNLSADYRLLRKLGMTPEQAKEALYSAVNGLPE
jgi:hypothetical protein